MKLNKLTRQHKNHSHIPKRLNILFFIVFVAITALVVQLAYLQLVHHETFQNKIDASTKKIIVEATPRGMIFDSKGQVLVGNKAIPAITYTKGTGTTAEEMRQTAEKLATLITVPEDSSLTPRDLKDFYLADPKNYQKILKRLTKKDLKNHYGDPLGEGVIYQKVVDALKEDEIQFTPEEKAAATLFKRMNAAYSLTTVFLKNEGVTNDEIAIVGERAQDLPGVSTGKDWQREYPYGNQMRSILGTVSTEKTGLPAEIAEKYLALGYAMNDRVGTSFLEEQYEQALQGIKMRNQVEMNRQGQIVSQVQSFAGNQGDNLVSSLDMTFQKKVDEILKKNYQQMVQQGKTIYSEGAYVAVVNPNNGDVLAISALDHDVKTNAVTENPLSAINNVFVPGSVVKGATITAGYQYGILKGNQVFLDHPLYFKGTPMKSSIFNRYDGNPMKMDAITALGMSSNVYMMHIALGLMGKTYQSNMALPGDLSVFNKLRNVYAQYGLGSATGLDVPNYSNGLVTPTREFLEEDGQTIKPGVMGLGLDLSYGNYDNYTVMQLAQYVSTIATKGKRYAPRLVTGIYNANEDGSLGAVKENFPPQLLNTVKLEEAQWDIIHQGFYATTHAPYGTAVDILGKAKYPVAAKTGTAETFYYPGDGTEKPTVNSTIVVYAPADKPKVALAVALPKLVDANGGFNQTIAKEILDAYYEMYEK